MRLEGTKVYLRPFEREHLEDPRYISWLRDYQVMRYIGRSEYFRPFGFEMVQDYIESLWKNPYVSFFAVHDRKDEAFVGTAKLSYLDETGKETRTADVGIMVGDRTRWGQGLAGNAVQTVCSHAFTDLEARKLTAGANGSNPAVLRLFERLGFVEEGRLRRKLLVEETYHDHVLLGCFKEEYKAQ